MVRATDASEHAAMATSLLMPSSLRASGRHRRNSPRRRESLRHSDCDTWHIDHP